jgi:DNA polymerase III subunit beta
MSGFTIQAGALRQALATARAGMRAGDRKIPVLAHVRLEGHGGALSVAGTDLDARCTATAAGSGALPPITASAARLAALLARIAAEDTVTLSIAETAQLVVATPALTARLYTLPAEDFPEGMPAPHEPVTCTMLAGDLRALLARPAHAVSTEETRYYLNGVHLHADLRDGQRVLVGVATDGHRIFVTEGPHPSGADLPAMIVPRLVADSLVGLLGAMPPETAVAIDAATLRLRVRARAWTLEAKLIDGSFPEYRHVIPPAEGTPIVVTDARGFRDALRTASSIGRMKSRPVKLGNGAGTTLTLSCAEAGDGDCTLTCPAEVAAWGSDATHPEVGFQARYLLDIARAFPGGFTMLVKDGWTPALITGATGTAVLMPMRV